jgi:Rhodopirellula transposase DDE domain
VWYACDMGSSAALLEAKFKRLRPHLNEASLRLWAANEALSLGYGGVSDVSRATGLSRTTIHAGIAELGKSVVAGERVRVRRTGGGRKTVTEKDPGLSGALNKLVDPVTRGDPESALRWTSKSTTRLAQELKQRGHPVSQRTVCDLLAMEGYSLQSVRKTREGAQHPDRDAQFHHLNAQVLEAIAGGQPVVSVDTKKKELVGDFKNAGQEWQRKGDPVKARVHDFVDPALGKAAPYGVYDLAANQGWVSVGIDHDTAEFAVESIRRWWQQMGNPLYPAATRLLITADCGGSNGYRVRLWKVALQRFANETNLTLQVCHLPPGTSKWNKIEHRMFCHITQNWRGRPLESLAVIVSLIGNTTTAKGLKIRAEIDASKYPKGQKVSDQELALVQIHPDAFHGEWNYAILPQSVE